MQATYTCHENYTLIGNENRTCQFDGWTGKQPQCLVDWCPEPPPISGGKVQLSGKRAGSTATYECDVGHVLIGEPVGFFDVIYSVADVIYLKKNKQKSSLPVNRFYLAVWAVNGQEKRRFVDSLIVEHPFVPTVETFN